MSLWLESRPLHGGDKVEVERGRWMCTLGGSRREKQKIREEEVVEEEEEEEETKTEP